MSTFHWVADPSHSEITFKVRHMMISNVTGRFSQFEASAETDDENFSNPRIRFSADIASIDTGSADRDTHLRSGDFFDGENNPKISFESTGFRKKNDDEYELTGNLTMRGVTKPVTLNVEFAGIGKDPWGNMKAGFTISGKVARKEWGLNWNAALEAGGVLVSEEVKLQAEVQMVLEVPQAA